MKMYDESTQVLLSSITSLQRTCDYSDLTIFCGHDVHRVHKAIVCPRSHFFAGACRIGQEAIKNEITLPDDEPGLVKLMIDYLYQLEYDFRPEAPNGIIIITEEELEPVHVVEPESPVAQVIGRFEDLSARLSESENEFWMPKTKKTKGKKRGRLVSPKGYPSPPAQNPTPPPPPPPPPPPFISDRTSSESSQIELNIHAQMYALADKYGIHDLKDLAREKFAEAASNDWDGGGFPLAVQTVYSSTPDSDHGLRDVVVDTLSRHKKLLEKPDVEELVKEINGLAFGLLKSAWNL